MKTKRLALMFVIALSLLSLNATAGQYTDTANRCFADSTTGKDRKLLARWIYNGMSNHPEIKQYSSPPQEVLINDNKLVAQLFTRLITESCRTEFRAAMKNEGEQSIESSFGHLGRLAMQELMGDPSVMQHFSGLEKYVDNNKIREAIYGK